jgi:hypothetical protein
LFSWIASLSIGDGIPTRIWIDSPCFYVKRIIPAAAGSRRRAFLTAVIKFRVVRVGTIRAYTFLITCCTKQVFLAGHNSVVKIENAYLCEVAVRAAFRDAHACRTYGVI